MQNIFSSTTPLWNNFLNFASESAEIPKALFSKVNLVAITTILQAAVIFGLYLLHPHVFTWTAVITFFFFSPQVNDAAEKINNLFINFINNDNFSFYVRIPIGIGTALVLLHNIPDWMNTATSILPLKSGQPCIR